MNHALYRHFDRDGQLLYVGISACPANRFTSHKSNSCWAPQVVRIELEWFDDRRAAFDAEQAAILAERPRFNVPRTRMNQSPVCPCDGDAA